MLLRSASLSNSPPPALQEDAALALKQPRPAGEGGSGARQAATAPAPFRRPPQLLVVRPAAAGALCGASLVVSDDSKQAFSDLGAQVHTTSLLRLPGLPA